eukprot:4532027-Amphidinium_carterae.1
MSVYIVNFHSKDKSLRKEPPRAKMFKRLMMSERKALEVVKGLKVLPWQMGGVSNGDVVVQCSVPMPVFPRERLPILVHDSAVARHVFFRRHLELEKFGFSDDCAGCMAARVQGPAATCEHREQDENRRLRIVPSRE